MLHMKTARAAIANKVPPKVAKLGEALVVLAPEKATLLAGFVVVATGAATVVTTMTEVVVVVEVVVTGVPVAGALTLEETVPLAV
jgi:hypothetical protein